MADCKHFEVCNLGAAHPGGFCILHLPEEGKVREQFVDALRHHLASGRTNFRHMFFLSGINDVFEGFNFQELADFRDAEFAGELHLNKAEFFKGLMISGKITEIRLVWAITHGPVEIKNDHGGCNIQLSWAKINDGISIECLEASSVNFYFAELAGQVRLRGRYQRDCIFDYATIRANVDLQQCVFRGKPTFHETVFTRECQLDLSDSSLLDTRGLRIIGSPIPPAAIGFDRAQIIGPMHIQAELGTKPIDIIAQVERPRFEDKVTFINVNLSKCRLVGNPITRMELTDVHWAYQHGRHLLYDEITKDTHPTIPLYSLKEAYQVLKQKYQQMGDHEKAGDFHYGEMDMKREAYGKWWHQLLSIEFYYWILSGYGTKPRWAGTVLIGLIIFFACFYWWTNPSMFPGGFSESLRFSVEVTILQRPVKNLNSLGQWFKVLQTVFGPLQIALFALALRMRLRR